MVVERCLCPIWSSRPLVLELQHPLGVRAEDFPLDVGGKLQRFEDRELRNGLTRLEKIRAEDDPVLAANQKVAAEDGVAADAPAPEPAESSP